MPEINKTEYTQIIDGVRFVWFHMPCQQDINIAKDAASSYRSNERLICGLLYCMYMYQIPQIISSEALLKGITETVIRPYGFSGSVELLTRLGVRFSFEYKNNDFSRIFRERREIYEPITGNG